jgi:hypothetical protein
VQWYTCTFHFVGVQCAKNTFISSVQLSNMYLSGTIPESAAALSHLQTLVLSANSISGWIPASISNLSSVLTTLDLSSNQLSGIPTELGLMTSLTVLDLDSNSFDGTLPTFLAELKQLSQLHLRSNAFEGLFPLEFCNMTGTAVNVQDNRFTCGNSCPNVPLGACISPTMEPTPPPTKGPVSDPILSSGSMSAIVVGCFVVVVTIGFLIFRHRHFEDTFRVLPLHKLLYRGNSISLAAVIDNETTLANRDKMGHTILEAVFEQKRFDLITEAILCFIVESH